MAFAPAALASGLLLAGSPPDAARNLACAPSPEVKTALATIPRRDAECDPADPCWLDKIRKAEALLDKYPFDVHVHRRYQDLVTARTHDDHDPVGKAAVDRYRRFLADHPDDPLSHYLVARFNDDRAEAEKALALNPTFPWPHGLLATLLRSSDPDPTPEASAAAGEHLETFAHLCPNRFDEILKRDKQTGDAAMWRRLLPPVRAALAKGTPQEQLPWYEPLWNHEFDAWPPAGHDAVRARVRADLARIEQWKRRDEESWWQALQAGYKMLDDSQAQQRIGDAYAKRFPCSWEGINHTIEAFVASRGGQEHLHDQTQTQWRDAYAQTSRWVKTCPDDYRYLSYRFEAAARLDSTDDRALVAEADRYLAAWERIASNWTVSPSPYHEVAAEYLSRGLDPARALELARKARSETAAQRAANAQALEQAGATDEQKHQSDGFNRLVDFDSLSLLAEAALASGDRTGGDAALAEAAAIYDALSGSERDSLSYTPGAQSRYWRVRARVAEADRHPPDALAYWRLAVQHADTRTAARTSAQDRAALDHLWRSLGGSDDALAFWMVPSVGAPGLAGAPAAPDGPAFPGRPATVLAGPLTGKPATTGWDTAADALPPFTLHDLTGRTWSLAELSGKTVFVNVWATWCGPCQAEIPHIRELDERLRGRGDVVLLSFNADDSTGVVAPFAHAHQMTWPVLFAATYFDRLPGAASVPQNWVIDGAGVRRGIQLGFDPRHADTWVDTALTVIDKAAAKHP
ncbi:MAG TPA: TlpA disulfide reductase family protein [Candidatus Polarisedimenticolia bacterium]|jgi:thiol-disulfide isomerase/thioredoxin|nr:TlpA disulfide reductase family protein [Candidatus Polarisedimenticolia bacterium]